MDTTLSIMIQCVISILLNGESVSPTAIFPKLGSHPWKHSPMVETEVPALLGTLFCFSRCVNMDLGPELFPYVVPLDCLVMTAQTTSSAASKTEEGM